MEDNRGEFYSNGYCTAFENNCDNKLKGACGICIIGGMYRKIISQLTSPENDLSKLCDANS